MRRICWALALAAGLVSLSVASASGASPIVNQTDHLVDQPFQEIGIDCATGQPTILSGSITGHVHTLVRADGSVQVSGAARGSNTADDLPGDGTPEASSTFGSSFHDVVLASGKEVHHFILNGSGSGSGVSFRFHFEAQLVIDQNGNPKIDIVNLRCF